MRKVRQGGIELDANFLVTDEAGQLTLTIESRGGTRGASNARNMDYDPGLELLLARLKDRRASISDALVVSTTALREFPAAADRRLDIDGGYPVRMADRDPAELRRAFGRAQRRAARDPALTSSGNNNKRVSFAIDLPGRSGADAVAVEAELAIGGASGRPSAPVPTPAPRALPGGAGTRDVAPDRPASGQPTRRSRAQGYVADAAYRRAVELRAMDVATRVFENDGWAVEDTSATSPYDLIIRRADELRYVEVKGTAGTGEQINLTANEVDHARRHLGDVVLFIVHSIHVDRSDPAAPSASGGTTRILDPFDLGAGQLRETAFTWCTRGAEQPSERQRISAAGLATE